MIIGGVDIEEMQRNRALLRRLAEQLGCGRKSIEIARALIALKRDLKKHGVPCR